jgi:ribonuclease BN (tRNA processing enzyme)
MEVLFLGTGTGVPSEKRASPALLILLENSTILIDAGPGTLRQLTKAGLSVSDLDYIFFTHFHPDHTADLVPYLFAVRYFPEFKRDGLPARIYGPPGFLKFHQHLKAAYGEWIDPGLTQVVLGEIHSGDRLDLDIDIGMGIAQISAHPISHTESSLGYRVKDKEGRVLALSGDTEYSQELINLAKEADLLVTEASFPEGMAVKGHLVPSEAGKAAAKANVKHLVLTHFYPQCEDQDILSPASKVFNGAVTLASDLMRVSV